MQVSENSKGNNNKKWRKSIHLFPFSECLLENNPPWDRLDNSTQRFNTKLVELTILVSTNLCKFFFTFITSLAIDFHHQSSTVWQWLNRRVKILWLHNRSSHSIDLIPPNLSLYPVCKNLFTPSWKTFRMLNNLKCLCLIDSAEGLLMNSNASQTSKWKSAFLSPRNLSAVAKTGWGDGKIIMLKC
jgi:hypothetical protein